MAFTLYSLLQAALLCVNAIAVLHEERFLKNSTFTFILSFGSYANLVTVKEKHSILHIWMLISPKLRVVPVGWGADQGIGGFGEEPGIKSQLMNLIRSVRTVMRVPLIIVNSVAIVLLLLFG